LKAVVPHCSTYATGIFVKRFSIIIITTVVGEKCFI
jgi:hypothetical protein